MFDRFDRPDQFTFPSARRYSLDPRDTEELVLCDLDDLDDLATQPDAPRPTPARPSPELTGREVLSISLPIAARPAYDAFCDVQAVPRWLPLVHAVRVLSSTASGRPERVAFVGRVDRSAIRYTLFYSHDEGQRVVSWGTAPGSLILIAGRAQFVPLGERATLMQYQLAVDLAEGAGLAWEDPFHGRHATSVVMNQFRDYIQRVHRSA
jgi:hypothetical protein